MVVWEETLERLYRMFLVRPSGRVLDLGTGFAVNLGLLLYSIPEGARVWSVDPDERALERAASRFSGEVEAGRLSLRVARAEELPFPSGFFDYVTSAMTFHHVDGKEKGLSEVSRVMRGNGLAIIADWAPGGAAYTPHSQRELERSMEEVLSLADKLFSVRVKKEERLFYYLVLEKGF